MKDKLRVLFSLERRRMDAALAIFDNAAVERRYSVEPVGDIGRQRSLTELQEQYRDHAIALGRDVAARALAAAGKRAEEIDLLITVSCTGIMIPSVDAHLVNELGFRSDVKRLPITELGCAGGAAALARASDFLVGFPDGNVLVVAIELPSLSLQRTDVSLANLVSTAIFGDGAAAAVVEPTDDPQRGILATALHAEGKFAEKLWLECAAARSRPRLTEDMVASESPRVFPRMEGRYVFKHAVERCTEVIQEALDAAGYTSDDIALLVPHQANLRI
ncbi:MAG: hypothetical protein ABUL63_03700, partial [Acidobacteriota bacterium]